MAAGIAGWSFGVRYDIRGVPGFEKDVTKRRRLLSTIFHF